MKKSKRSKSPKIIFENIRKLLERNKIFFEIFAYTFLGIMSIALVYNSNKIAKSAVKNDKVARLPIIRLKIEDFYNNKENKFYDIKKNKFYKKIKENVVLTNYGNSIIDSQIQFDAYLVFHKTNSEKFYFEMYDYFSHFERTHNTIGEIYKIIGLDKTYSKTSLLMNELMNYRYNDSFQDFDIYEETIIEMQYTDIFEETHNILFQVLPRNTIIISENDSILSFQKDLEKKIITSFFINDPELSSKEIYNTAKAHMLDL